MPKFRTIFAVILALSLGAYATQAAAAPPKPPEGPTEIEECQIITEPGSYRLINNLPGAGGLLADAGHPAFGDCLIADADNVTIDLAGFTIDGAGSQGMGIASGVSTSSAGLVLIRTSRAGITITNGTVTGFTFGIFLGGGPGHVVEGVRVSDNGEGGALIVQVVGSRLTGNIIVDNALSMGNAALRVKCPALVERNVVVDNSLDAITAAGGPPITDCTLDSNRVGP